MKKSLIALAVAATATAATPMTASAATLQAAGDQEGIELYGSFRPEFVKAANSDIGDGGSRWGIQGSQDLGNGLSVFYQLERRFSTSSGDLPTTATMRIPNPNLAPGVPPSPATPANVTQVSINQDRQAYAGLRGSFGAISVGRQWAPYYQTIASPSDLFLSGQGISNFSGNGIYRMDQSLIYALPDGGLVNGKVAIRIDESNADGAARNNIILREQSLGLNINTGPLTIGLGYHNVEDTQDNTRLGLSLGASTGPISATFMVEGVDQGGTTTNPWAITGSLRGFDMQYSDTDTPNGTAITLGYTHNLSATTRLQVAWEDNNRLANDILAVRYRLDF